MADLYRKAALERISSPEQLDKTLKVTSPMSWLALVGISLILVVTLIWSIVGTIPVTITTKGIVSAQVGSNTVYAQDAGTVISVRVRPGQEIQPGDPVLTYKNAANEVVTVYSDQWGTVASLVAKKDDVLTPGSDLIRVTPTIYDHAIYTTREKQMVVCYVPLAQAKKLEREMQVKITLDAMDSQSYGNMRGRIVNIDAYATSTAGMSGVLGTGNNLESTFTGNGAVVAVACELYPDESTVSGFLWSNRKGAQVQVTNGSLVTAKIVTEEVPPISKLFSEIKELWGD